MKMKTVLAVLTAAILALGTFAANAEDYNVSEDTITVVARFFITADEYPQGGEFSMTSEDGEIEIHITDDTAIYFEDYVPLSDECDGLTNIVREVLFGRTLAEVLNNRNLSVTFADGEQTEPTSIVILFETIVPLPETVSPGELDDEDDIVGIVTLPAEISPEYAPEPYEEEYTGAVTLPAEIDLTYFDPALFSGEVVIDGNIVEAALPAFYNETENAVMIPLRAVAEALDYNVSWNGELQSVQLGVAIHVWIGRAEAYVGRMAPIALSAAPVIVDGVTFVPLDFLTNVLRQDVRIYEGRVVIG